MGGLEKAKAYFASLKPLRGKFLESAPEVPVPEIPLGI